MIRELLLSGPTSILLSQPPVVTVSFDLLRADRNLGGGLVIREVVRVPAELIFSKYRVKYCQGTKPEILFLA